MQRKSRQELLRDLNEALRKVSAQSVLLSEAVSRLVGVNATDLECLDLLLLSGSTTAGQLAAHSGLTTGAMTAVIDRLERAGFARRRRDLTDRRRVLVEALPRVVQDIGPLYRPLARATDALHAEYDDRQLALVADYLSRAFGLAAEHVNWLQTQPPLPRKGRARKTAPATVTPARVTPARVAPAASRTTAQSTPQSTPQSTARSTAPATSAERKSTQTTWSRIASPDIERSRARR